MRLTRNSIALSGNFGKIDPRIHFDVFQITLTYVRAILKNVKIDLGLFFPNCPQSHAITSTKRLLRQQEKKRCERAGAGFRWEKLLFVHVSSGNRG